MCTYVRDGCSPDFKEAAQSTAVGTPMSMKHDETPGNTFSKCAWVKKLNACCNMERDYALWSLICVILIVFKKN